MPPLRSVNLCPVWTPQSELVKKRLSFELKMISANLDVSVGGTQTGTEFGMLERYYENVPISGFA
jgi:hypothetical protein